MQVATRDDNVIYRGLHCAGRSAVGMVSNELVTWIQHNLGIADTINESMHSEHIKALCKVRCSNEEFVEAMKYVGYKVVQRELHTYFNVKFVRSRLR